MDLITPEFIGSVTSRLAANLIAATGRRVRDALATPGRAAALERCVQAGVLAMVAQARGMDTAHRQLLTDILDRFFGDPDTASAIASLTRGLPLDRDELLYAFEHAGYDAATLPGIDLGAGIVQFEAAFLIAAVAEPELQGTIQASQALEQTRMLRELRAQLSGMVEFLRPAALGTVGISADTITATNVVSGVQVNFTLPPVAGASDGVSPTSSTLLEAYLGRVTADAGRLSLAGVDPAVATAKAGEEMQLGAIYTALATYTPEESKRMEGGGPGMPRDTRRHSALDQLNRHRHLVLLGDPGSGKSTFVNFVALCLAGEMLGLDAANLAVLRTPLPADGEDRDATRDGGSESKAAPQPWDHGPLLPVRVVLRDFAARGLPTGQSASAEHLWQFIEAELAAAALEEFAPHLKTMLMDKGGLVVLDGLDEVPEAAARRQAIVGAIEDFATTFRRCRIVVTSRTYAYQSQEWRLKGFHETRLAPFNDAQIRHFVERWYEHVAQQRNLAADDARGRAERLKHAIFTRERLHELAERPLLLTLMASLHAWRGGNLPEKREQLYAEAVTLLLELWERQRTVCKADGAFEIVQPSLVEYLNLKDRDKVRKLLEQLAFDAHASQTEATGTADIAEDALVGGLTRISSADVKPKLLVEYLCDRTGLLIERGEDAHGKKVFTFPHRTFQEYLAACHLTNDGAFARKAAGLARVDPGRWREVLLLAGAKASAGAASTIWQLASELSFRSLGDGDLEMPADLWGSRLAGQALVESADLDDMSDSNQKQIDALRPWLLEVMGSPAMPPIERAGAGDSLAVLGDRRDTVMTIDGMRLAFVPAGTFTMGDGKDAHVLPLPDFFIGIQPVTIAQFAGFTKADGYANPAYWSEAREAGLWQDGRIRVYSGLMDGSVNEAWHDRPIEYGTPFTYPNHPVVGVSWYEMLAFTRWMTERLRARDALPSGWSVTLPSEAEWEKAARGGAMIPVDPITVGMKDLSAVAETINGQGATKTNPLPVRAFPWGDELEAAERSNCAHADIGATSSVGCFPHGASPYGCEEMAGNVWEWTRTVWGKSWRDEDSFRYPYDPRDGRELLTSAPHSPRVLRGGSFYLTADDVRCAARDWVSPHARNWDIGFRVVVAPFHSGL